MPGDSQGLGRVSRDREQGPQLLLQVRKRQATMAHSPESMRGGPAEPAHQVLGFLATSCCITMSRSGEV